MLDRGLRRAFPRAVELEADETAAAVPQRSDDRRRDLRDLATFTIDPTTAKDFDDAISAQREGDAIRVWVHIADVSAFVRPGRAVDLEAYRRGTSVYVPGAVEPMLPEALSNRACSLVPGEERLAVTVEMELRGVDVRSVSFHRSLIRSDARLTYEQVDRIFAGEEEALAPWAEPLAAAREAARALREWRAQRGSLEVESSEPQFEFDERGYVVGVHHEEQTESHSADRAAHDPRQRAGGGLPRGPRRADALPRARAAQPAVDRVARHAARLARGAHAAGAEADDSAAGGRAGGRDQPHGGRAPAPHRPRPGGVHVTRAALAQAGLLLAEERRARRPGQRRATATSPRPSAATRTWWCTARCCHRSGSTTRRRAPPSWTTSASRARPPSATRWRSSAGPPTSVSASCSSGTWPSRATRPSSRARSWA